jgi:hypothetical protein
MLSPFPLPHHTVDQSENSPIPRESQLECRYVLVTTNRSLDERVEGD